MAIRDVGAGEELRFLVTEARPISTYAATNPAVGDFVRITISGAKNIPVSSTAAGFSTLKTIPYPWGIVKNVNKDSSIVTVQWMNVLGVANFQYSGTATRGLALQHVNTATNNKVSCIATAAAVPKAYVVAVDTPASGYLQAFIL